MCAVVNEHPGDVQSRALTEAAAESKSFMFRIIKDPPMRHMRSGGSSKSYFIQQFLISP